MHERDPRRLKLEQGTPDALVQALQALRNGPDDAARLARVSKRLEPMLDAPPPAAPVPVAEPIARPGFSKLPLVKLLVGGLAVVAPLLWFARASLPSQSSEPAALASPAAQPAAPTPPASAQPSSSAEAVPQTPPIHTPSDSIRTRGSFPQGKSARKRGESSTRSARSHSRSSESRTAAADEQTAETNQPEPSQPVRAATVVKPEAQKPSTQATERKPVVANGSVPRTASESELLFEARKALPDDAELALRLLTEHTARFPKGQLVPEREVLAIESLRSLGRTQEADARLQRFQARYPNSLHLQRLKH